MAGVSAAPHQHASPTLHARRQAQVVSARAGRPLQGAHAAAALLRAHRRDAVAAVSRNGPRRRRRRTAGLSQCHEGEGRHAAHARAAAARGALHQRALQVPHRRCRCGGPLPSHACASLVPMQMSEHTAALSWLSARELRLCSRACVVSWSAPMRGCKGDADFGGVCRRPLFREPQALSRRLLGAQHRHGVRARGERGRLHAAPARHRAAHAAHARGAPHSRLCSDQHARSSPESHPHTACRSCSGCAAVVTSSTQRRR